MGFEYRVEYSLGSEIAPLLVRECAVRVSNPGPAD
jgi:hypothetical protein